MSRSRRKSKPERKGKGTGRRTPPRTEWCFGCDTGQHHPGRHVKGCQCPCGYSQGS